MTDPAEVARTALYIVIAISLVGLVMCSIAAGKHHVAPVKPSRQVLLLACMMDACFAAIASVATIGVTPSSSMLIALIVGYIGFMAMTIIVFARSLPDE
ncbi:MAG: hypothetical protein NUV56_00225 [Candidatus Uhrbacteria bacterium]|nr:hypothetical protein [Candidatus Uhrbacteria bacterium]